MTDSITQYSLKDSFTSNFLNVSELSDESLVQAVEKLRQSKKLMEVENFMFENFLNRNEPGLIAGLQAFIVQQMRLLSKINIGPVISATKTLGSDTALSSRLSRASIVFTIAESKKRINLQTRTDILMKEKDMFMKHIEKYRRNALKKRKAIKGEIEELELRIFETTEANKAFENLITKEKIDFRSSRIPTEKYMRFLDDWLKGADGIIEKLRLRTSTLKYKQIYLQNQLKQKEELGEALHPVDLDQLRIERSVLTKKLEQKNQDLLDLKKQTGEANLELSKHKIFLQIQMKQLSDLVTRINNKEQKIINLNKEIIEVGKEVTSSAEKLKQIEHLVNNYTVPDLMDYIQNNNQVFELNRNIKIWTRRNKIQQSALETCIKTMKRLTGRKVEDPEWFILKQKKEEDDMDKEEVEEEEEEEDKAGDKVN